jgi:hypothetical protein
MKPYADPLDLSQPDEALLEEITTQNTTLFKQHLKAHANWAPHRRKHVEISRGL